MPAATRPAAASTKPPIFPSMAAIMNGCDRIFCGSICTHWGATDEQRLHWPPRHSGASVLSEESLPAVLTFPQFPLCLCSVIWPHRPAYRRHENYSRRARLPAPNPACWPNHLQTPWLQTLGTAPLCSWTKCTSCTSPWCRCELGGQCKMRCCTRGHSLSACGKFASGVRCHAARQTAALRCLPAPP